jgi:hypothetical protein
MKNYWLFGLLTIAVVFGTSAYHLLNKSNDDLGQELAQSQGADLEIMLDEETGEMITDPQKINKMMELKKTEKVEKAKKEKPAIVMTEMEDGAIKVDLGRRYVKPRSASIDEDGNFINEEQIELSNEEVE